MSRSYNYRKYGKVNCLSIRGKCRLFWLTLGLLCFACGLAVAQDEFAVLPFVVKDKSTMQPVFAATVYVKGGNGASESGSGSGAGASSSGASESGSRSGAGAGSGGSAGASSGGASGSGSGASSDEHGVGKLKINKTVLLKGFEVRVSAIGFQTKTFEFEKGIRQLDTLRFFLSPADMELSEVKITTTRTNNHIEENPTKVEVLGLEEINEEVVMNPGNVTKLLGETSGIMSRQASAASGNVSFRILGLPGQYTQLLQDGFPLYSGPSNGLSLVQIPPLDLQQVEIVKGASSALFGGEAVAGIVNLITKTPKDSVGRISAIVNQTSEKGEDASLYFSKRTGKWGFTLLTGMTQQEAVDLNGDGFADLPQLRQLNFKPKLFYNPNSHLTVTFALQVSSEVRTSGDLQAILYGPDSIHSFTVKQNTVRKAGLLTVEEKLKNGDVLLLKSSVSGVYRSVMENNYFFGGNQLTSFGELTWLHTMKNQKLVVGSNWIGDGFEQINAPVGSDLSYQHSTIGLFAEDNLTIGKQLNIQGGLRIDDQNKYGLFVLPRLAACYKFSPHFYWRIGGGMGYKTPSVFMEESESAFFRNIVPISNAFKAEQSQGITTDLNYKIDLTEEMILTINQSFFYTLIQNAIYADEAELSMGRLVFDQSNSGIKAIGGETSVKVRMDETEFSAGYTNIQAQINGSNLAYTPKDRVVLALATGEEKNWRIGVEAFYTGIQFVENQNMNSGGSGSGGGGNGGNTEGNIAGRDFWTFGALIQKTFGHFTIIGNVENIFDVKQSNWGPIITGNLNNPIFQPLYAPVEGRVFNLAVRMEF